MAADGFRRAPLTAAALAERVWLGDDAAAAAMRVALAPAELAFRAASRARNALYDRGLLRVSRAAVPVISIGNLTVGGAGKTPFTRHVVERLLERGAKPAILHGGYGDDEPALHRLWHPDVPVVAGRDRVATARSAVAAGANVLVLDDGFQHRRQARDLDIVLVAAETHSQPVRLLPRGPWREPFRALRRAGLIVVTRRTAAGSAARSLAESLRVHAAGTPFVIAALYADRWRDRDGQPSSPPVGPAFAVTSIAQPAAFLENARNAGADVRDGIAFPDHHAFSAADVRRIVTAAADRTLILTEKDAVKLEPLLPDASLRVLLQRVRIEEGRDELEDALDAGT